ncbi:MAG TPA: NUDIX domain-containing protein [Candidatus Polarisedimenticolia bacterium]|nr:NUDIX domain-containing protein [Candidatus Polarisedimenticolia bacterium]
MSPRRSAGLLLYRESPSGIEVLLVHPGGPFWAKKDDGAWTIPKGLIEAHEDPLAAARREFEEETGLVPPSTDAIPLDPLRQPGGKIVHAWAVLGGDFDPAGLRSNTFTMEWPPKSGAQKTFPEIDRAAWFPLDAARLKILQGQAGFLDQLEKRLGRAG